MKFYIRITNPDGTITIREATRNEILDSKSELCEEDGSLINRQPVVHVDNVEDLSGVIRELALAVTSVGAIKTRTEQMEAQLAAYRESAERGFTIPSPGAAAGAGADPFFAPYDLAHQGRSLVDRFAHPVAHVSEEKKQEIAKYFVTFIKAAYFRSPAAIQRFNDVYMRTGTTELGDTGNVFPVPDIVDSEIFAFAREKSVALQYARIWDMTSDKMSFPQEATSVAVAWGNTTAKSDPTIAEVQLDAEELSAYSAVRNSTLADSRSDIVSWLTEMMAEASGLELDNVMFNGDGTSTYAYCSGILSAACGNSVVMDSGSTAFSQMGFVNLSNMIAQLDGLRKQGGRFFMHGSILHYVRTMVDDNNRPIFYETVGQPTSGQVMGYPYTEAIKGPSTSAASTPFIVFGNLRYFAIGRRLGATALQIDPYGQWTTNRTRFKIYQRWGLEMGLPDGFVRLITAAE